MNRVAKNTNGFTIVELMLAMMFVSVLLIAIALTIIQISNIYNKGLTMKAVDEAGRDISTDMRLTIGQSQPFNAATSYRVQSSPGGNKDGGRFCTGTYSYVWNFGKTLSTQINKYDSSSDMIRLVKVRDGGGQYCLNPARKIIVSDATELLSEGDRDLAVQSFSLESLAEDPASGQALYRIVMEIGTNERDALEENLTTLDTTCKPPSDVATLSNFCAVNRFDFTAQAGNRGGR